MSASPSSPLVAQGVAASERSRSALRICFEILEMVRDKGPSESTNIKRMANLSHVGFTKYLEKLVSQGLLREDEDQSRNGKSYTLTAKGLDFVNQVREMEAFLAGFGLSL